MFVNSKTKSSNKHPTLYFPFFSNKLERRTETNYSNFCLPHHQTVFPTRSCQIYLYEISEKFRRKEICLVQGSGSSQSNCRDTRFSIIKKGSYGVGCYAFEVHFCVTPLIGE